MKYLWQHIEQILAVYDGGLPLHHFLKGYFKGHAKLGSRDRKAISHAVYSWYRTGHALEGNTEQSLQNKVLAAMYLCGGAARALTGPDTEFFLDYPGSPATAAVALEQAGYDVRLSELFPQAVHFSKGIDQEEWATSLLAQPRLFLRIRKDAGRVKNILAGAAVAHEWLSKTCVALPNGTKVETLLPEDVYVVQDASSQATGQYLKGKSGEHWWDCCSGAGGKSLMLAEASKGIQLLTTDIRDSILHNLAARFRQYQLPLPERQVLDASNADELARHLEARRFDGIICDVPCSGSGTWARTPEAAYFFQAASLERYSERQAAILRNAASYLSDSGRIVYITCSVFSAENEALIGRVAQERGLEVESQQLINGIAIQADSLFVAVLRKA